MIYPSYAIVEKKLFSEYPMSQSEVYRFGVFIQGFKMDIGFKVSRRLCHKNGLRNITYEFTRYGWSTGMLRWRSLTFRQRISYLENFFQYADKDKIENFLFRERNVLIEKSYKWPDVPFPIVSFKR